MKKPLSSLRNVIRVGHSPAVDADGLTGFTGRTQLLLDLERACLNDDDHPRMVVLIDLLGFKEYNDTFGHPAGDALLRRLARNFSQVVSGRGSCYRLDGVEFAALLDVENDSATLADHVSAALTEEGEGFAVAPTYGMAVVPHEATTPGDALRIANERMYALRYSLRPGVGTRASSEVLMEALDKRAGTAGDHVRGLSEIVEAVAHQMALDAEQLEQVRLAAALHDVGKAAVPMTILSKRFKLDKDEREFIERHPQIGERILRAAPALGRVARLVRWSHERYDGTGYPDRLRGEEIPIGSRIIAVCDAFDAMIAPRPYRQALTPEQAIGELQRCAGTQFDPGVVAAFCTVMEERERFFAAA